MKQSEIKKCGKCGKGVMHTGMPLFYRLKVQRFGIDVRAVQRRAGLEMMMGGGTPGAVLAGVLGPDEELAKPLTEEQAIILCEECADQQIILPLLMETEEGATS